MTKEKIKIKYRTKEFKGIRLGYGLLLVILFVSILFNVATFYSNHDYFEMYINENIKVKQLGESICVENGFSEFDKYEDNYLYCNKDKYIEYGSTILIRGEKNG